MNRASPWLDVDSYLPYAGKVVLKNKTAKKLSVRIPRWVDKKAVRCSVNEKVVLAVWLNNYLLFEELGKKDVVTIEFPMVESTEKYTVYGRQFICRFKGNTLIHIEAKDGPPLADPAYRTYQREHYRQTKAPMKKVTRYVSPVIIAW